MAVDNREEEGKEVGKYEGGNFARCASAKVGALELRCNNLGSWGERPRLWKRWRGIMAALSDNHRPLCSLMTKQVFHYNRRPSNRPQ